MRFLARHLYIPVRWCGCCGCPALELPRLHSHGKSARCWHFVMFQEELSCFYTRIHRVQKPKHHLRGRPACNSCDLPVLGSPSNSRCGLGMHQHGEEGRCNENDTGNQMRKLLPRLWLSRQILCKPLVTNNILVIYCYIFR